MSLADLPDVLIAHLTTYLSYEETCDLMETSKKNYNAIKGYKKDKPKFQTVDFHVLENPISYYTREGGNSFKSYKLKNNPETDDVHEYIKEVIDKCQSIDWISFPYREEHGGYYHGDLTRPLVKILYETKTKIRSVSVSFGSVDLSMDEFIKFCRKFKGSSFSNCEFNFKIWSDEVLVNIFPHSNADKLIGEFENWTDHDSNLLTDASLKAMIGEKDIRTSFRIKGVPNSFTVEQIVKNLEVLRTRDNVRIDWNLGILPEYQIFDADRYFNFKNGELKEFYDLAFTKYDGKNEVEFKLTNKTANNVGYKNCHFEVKFSVAIEYN